jgi:hypothetical protein
MGAVLDDGHATNALPVVAVLGPHLSSHHDERAQR